MPASKDELGGYTVPAEDEKPFYVLLEDDKLVSHVSVTTDTLLEPTAPDAGDHDLRVTIAVRLRPFIVTWGNINFS